MDYLPKDATIEEACNWLQAKTGQTWVLARLLECHLTPHFWLDYKPGYPAIYGNKIEGYQTRMMFQGDLCRLESDRGDALVNMFTAHDGTLVKVEPGLRVPLNELKFKRESVERVAEIINKTAPAQSAATPAPVVIENASNAPVDGITTAQVAAFFDAMPFTAENWPKRLSDAKWLKPAQIALGAAGGATSLWCPATLARLIHSKEQGKAKQKTLEALNRKFKSNPALEPWRTAWDEHYAMFNDADGSH